MSERLFLRLDDDPVQGPEADAPAGTLRASPVSAALRAHVSHVLLCREDFAAGHEVMERVLPDGAVRLIFDLGEIASPCAFVVGAATAPALVRLRGRMDGVSVTLRPGAVADLLGVPAGELAGTAVPLEMLWQGQGMQLLERMAEAPDDAARVARLQAALQRRVTGDRRASAAQQAATHAARLIATSGGRRPLREVAAAVGVGERRLQQLFHAQVGLSPRAWARLARLHDCLRGLRGQAAPDWAAVAIEHGYYDQSHLANEFRTLCGLTPTEFLGRALSGSSKTAD
ncbi:helix-turn-helix domain-containing protein [Variovorax soli]|uniref:Methylphosphotriester-DNA--protein-cysteine methyltransferase n=1 Tax=Variovorax soli TaxID=376815 RepID=A0ABU1NBY9_9BURK|nr:helix-turn-helix domain-containing protein [Variovorax soli]MDR6535990.1 methylphosphotriester-DNA--protein-cysteine methyltransferase [Variovorax soli]